MMRTLVIISVIFSFQANSQSINEELLFETWYHCDSINKPDSVTSISLYTREIECNFNDQIEFWKFSSDGLFSWSDKIPSNTITIDNQIMGEISTGIIVTSQIKWKLDNNIISIDNNDFKIEVLTKDYLLLKRTTR